MDWFWYFVIYSFLGYLLEILFARATHSPRQVRKCFLLLPLCPVYGLAMTAILLLGARSAENIWQLLALGAGAATAVEFAVHWMYERWFGVHFWDYSQLKLDVCGRISFSFSVLWGVLSLFGVRVLQPYIEMIVRRIPLAVGNAVLLLLVIDAMYSARVLLLYHDTELLSLRALWKQQRAESRA